LDLPGKDVNIDLSGDEGTGWAPAHVRRKSIVASALRSAPARTGFRVYIQPSHLSNLTDPYRIH
jgi:hypothetical protein